MFYVLYNMKDLPSYGLIPSKDCLKDGFKDEKESLAWAEQNGLKRFSVLKKEGEYEMQPRVTYSKVG